jgi:hypothetical protein
MRYTEAQQIRSEIGTVERFLKELPESAIIERMSWESRLESLREQLAEAEARPQAHPLSITFRGSPVEDSRSIDATFAGKALKAFVEATDTVAASLVTDDLRDHGRLPGAGDRSLRIIDTARGSFGFELELPPPPAAEDEAQEELFPDGEPDPHVEAIATTMRLLGEAASDDEDAISDLIAEMHPRAAAKVRAFANVLAESEALFAVSFREKQVRFDSDAQVKRVIESLADSDISEDDEQHTGTIIGLLPKSRRFEAKLADGKVVQGKVDRSVTDISGFKAKWENRKAKLEFRVVRVRTRSRYILTGAA